MKHTLYLHQFLFILFFFFISNQLFAQQWPTSLVGRWTFDNPNDLLNATIGNNLTLTGTHTLVSGFTWSDSAIAIGVGSYYTCTHGIAANGGGSLVNKYSILFDIKIDNPKQYHCFYQTNQENTNDGEVFINPFSQIGISGTGYSGFSLKANEWYRIIITVDLGNSIRYYVDGKLVLDGVSQAIDGRYSLDPNILFFADEDGEDNPVYVSQIAMFNNSLTNNEVRLLSGFHNSFINPYLQSPTPTSIFVSWNSYYGNSTIVKYSTNQSLSESATGTYEDIGNTGSINRFHTVQLTGLQPNTKYFYRCISGSDTSDLYFFKTPPETGVNEGHIRFLKFGDNQTYTLKSTAIVDSVIKTMKQLYGISWKDSISLITSTGDITENGLELGRYNNEYFNPFSKLTAYIPSMVSIGNHELESDFYYQFMKYENFSSNNEISYAFNLGNCQFIFMNTNGLYNNSSQSTWLEDQLELSEQDSLIDFVFIFNHQPGLSELWPDGNNTYTNNILYPIEAQFSKVVLSSHGHSHCYERGDFRGTHDQNWDFRTLICGVAGGELDNWGDYSNQTDYLNVHRSFDMYGFLLVDINMGTKTVEATFYTVGNDNKPRSVMAMDHWRRYDQMNRPGKPDPIEVYELTPNQLSFFITTNHWGDDTTMSTQIQIISGNGDFSNPMIDSVQHFENYYGDSGAPNYDPLQLFEYQNIYQLNLDFSIFNIENEYKCRMRKRDMNLKWSDWSDTLSFTPSTVSIDPDKNSNLDLVIFPNPSTGKLTILSGVTMNVKLINQLGKNLMESKIDPGNNSLDLSKLNDGLYFIQYQINHKMKTKKIIKLSK